MTRTILDISILQTVPPSNLNRDDTGSPKTAHFGGVRRARVSSQAWKRAARVAFNASHDTANVGVRSVRIVEQIAEHIQRLNSSIERERALELATITAKEAGISLNTPRPKKDENGNVIPEPSVTGFLYFLSTSQLSALAQIAVDAEAEDPSGAQATIKAAKPKSKLNLDHSIDIALFGRMVADHNDLNVDASAQVAHAISVHAVDNEFDYYTAVDDYKNEQENEDAGAGMIGTIEFNSSTLYRYATVDVDALHTNLADSAEATASAVRGFVDAFATSMPTGKQNTFANGTLPDAVVVSIRERQPVNLVGAFEEPITAPYVRNAAAKLVAHAQHIDTNLGTTPAKVWVVTGNLNAGAVNDLGDTVTLDELMAELGETITERVGAHTGSEQ